MSALQAAIDEFNHDNCHKHDQELELQADKILFQKIAYCFTLHKHDDEMGILACALEMVYRASRGRVALSFQEVQDSILPLFVEMLRWSAARRKHILTIAHFNSQTQKVPTIDLRHNVVDSSVVSAGTFYTKMKETNNEEMNGGVGNTYPKERTSGQLHPPNDNASIVSILRNDSVSAPPIPNTPFRGKPRLPDELPKEIPQNTMFTIECIPNGTETASFVPETLGNKDQEVKVATENQGGNCDGDPQEKDSASTASTAASDETQTSPLSGKKKDSPDGVRSFPESRTQRQVRFSKHLHSGEALAAPKTNMHPYSSRDYQDRAINNTSMDVGALNSAIEQQNKKIKRKKEKYTHPLSVLKVLKILRYFSRVLSAMVPMAHFPGLLDELIFQMRIRKAGTDSTDSILRKRQNANTELDDDLNSFKSARSSESGQVSETKQRSSQYLDNASAARMDAIATIVNLACAEENKMKLLSHPGLLDAVILVAEHDIIDNAREHASIVFMNLALAEENKVRSRKVDLCLCNATCISNM